MNDPLTTEPGTISDRKADPVAVDEMTEQIRTVVHDFNNVLYALAGYVEVALDDVGPEDPVLVYLREMQKAVRRAGEVVTRLDEIGNSPRTQIVREPEVPPDEPRAVTSRQVSSS